MEAGAATGWGLGVLGEESQGRMEGQGPWVGEGSGHRPAAQATVQRPSCPAAAGGGWARRARDLPRALRPPGLPPRTRRTPFSRSHQPDSPRGRLRRQTAMHRAPPPAPAPQPACAIARPPARSLPRAVSRFQGRRTFSSPLGEPLPGPGTRLESNRARSTPRRSPHPHPRGRGGCPLILVPGPLEPRPPGSAPDPSEPRPAPGRADARPSRPAS